MQTNYHVHINFCKGLVFYINVLCVVDYGPAIIEHVLQSAGFVDNAKIGRGFDITTGTGITCSLYTLL